MSEMRYTPGPWRVVEKGGGWREIWAGDRAVVRADGCYRAKYEDYECGVAISEPNAQRIVACVNACDGIPTEALEAGVVRKLIESATKTVLALLGRIEALEQERDAARADAERWRKQYEALRAGVEQVARDLNARTRIHRQLISHYHDGAADAYEEAERWVRHLLSDANLLKGEGGATHA